MRPIISIFEDPSLIATQSSPAIFDIEVNKYKHKIMYLIITENHSINLLPVPIKESIIRTFFDPEISIPSVLGLSSGAVI